MNRLGSPKPRDFLRFFYKQVLKNVTTFSILPLVLACIP